MDSKCKPMVEEEPDDWGSTCQAEDNSKKKKPVRESSRIYLASAIEKWNAAKRAYEKEVTKIRRAYGDRKKSISNCEFALHLLAHHEVYLCTVCKSVEIVAISNPPSTTIHPGGIVITKNPQALAVNVAQNMKCAEDVKISPDEKGAPAEKKVGDTKEEEDDADSTGSVPEMMDFQPLLDMSVTDDPHAAVSPMDDVTVGEDGFLKANNLPLSVPGETAGDMNVSVRYSPNTFAGMYRKEPGGIFIPDMEMPLYNVQGENKEEMEDVIIGVAENSDGEDESSKPDSSRFNQQHLTQESRAVEDEVDSIRPTETTAESAETMSTGGAKNVTSPDAIIGSAQAINTVVTDNVRASRTIVDSSETEISNSLDTTNTSKAIEGSVESSDADKTVRSYEELKEMAETLSAEKQAETIFSEESSAAPDKRSSDDAIGVPSTFQDVPSTSGPVPGSQVISLGLDPKGLVQLMPRLSVPYPLNPTVILMQPQSPREEDMPDKEESPTRPKVRQVCTSSKKSPAKKKSLPAGDQSSALNACKLQRLKLEARKSALTEMCKNFADLQKEPDLFKGYICRSCLKNHESFEDLRKHIIGEKLVNKNTCPYCHRFFYGSHLKEHIRSHTGERPFVCPTCNHTYKYAHQLVTHKRKHTGEKPYMCEYCGKAYTTSENLAQHIRRHTGERPYTCDICGKKFSSCRAIKQHARVHAEKQFQCQYCLKWFQKPWNLKQHIRIHTGERYHCHFCEKKFTQNWYLKCHEKTHLGDDDSTRKTAKKNN